jgi:hypothetical protein
MDMLTIIIERDKVDGQIKGLVPHLVDHGLSISHYADDTVLILDHDIEQNNAGLYSHLFSCKSGTYPFRYMGLLMIYRKLKGWPGGHPSGDQATS